MTVGALIGAYQEDDSGALRALFQLSGRTLLEYQVRCAAAAGASPIVIMLEETPAALDQALQRLHKDGTAVLAVTDPADAANRFGSGDLVLVIGDGIAPPPELVATTAAADEATIVTVPDDSDHQLFERIDAASRWAGLALVDAQELGATASMLGDWDLQSTLLRRTLQSGARLNPIVPGNAEPILASDAQDLTALDRELLKSSRANRTDWASRFILPVAEDVATEALSSSTISPHRLIELALLLTAASAVAFLEGWRWAALVLLVLSTPLDLVAARLASIRLSPLPSDLRSQRLLWPAAGLSLAALGWWQSNHGGGWGAFYAALVGCAFAHAERAERRNGAIPGELWLFSRRNAILAMLPFAGFGAWTAGIVALSLYAAGSFFVSQFVNHSIPTG